MPTICIRHGEPAHVIQNLTPCTFHRHLRLSSGNIRVTLLQET